MNSSKKAFLDLLWNEPYKIGHWVGFKDLTTLHNEWLRSFLYADEDQISQVLVNLIRNAIQAKATTIDITAEIDLNEAVIVNISNNGNPISKENYEDIFVPFYTTKQEGTGVGLSLSRQIMRLHNGSISLVCSNEKNTVFKLQFK